MSVGGYIRIYLAVYGPEIILAISVLRKKSQKTKVICSLGRANHGGLRNLQPPIIGPHFTWSRAFHICCDIGTSEIDNAPGDVTYQVGMGLVLAVLTLLLVAS